MTLRRRLVIALLLLLTGVGIVGSVAAYFVARQEPDNFLDDRLVQVARYVGDTAPPPTVSDLPALEPEDAILIQIWKTNGTPVRLSDPTINLPRRTGTGFADVEVAGETWRSYGLVDGQRIVQISERMKVRNELATNSAIRSALPLILLVPLFWLVVGSVIDTILKPLSNLALKVRAREPGSSEPLPVAGLPGEILPVVHAVNDLLQRQHKLLQSRERFISDAAHQLRTPLTALRLQAGNLSGAKTAKAREAMLADIRRGILRMSSLADQLLTLARADQPAGSPPASACDLTDLVKDAVSDCLPLAESLGADLGFAKLEKVTIACAPDDVRMIVANLLDNAIRYSGARGRIDVETYSDKERAIIRVTDNGPGIAAADLPFVFDRFFRADESVSQGSGLGLSIAKALAQRGGADLSIRNRLGQSGLMAELSIPIPPISLG
jgi:signal transduction histidine kinase